MADIGDNSGETLGKAGQDQLKSLAERINRLFDDRDALNEDVKEVFQEAKDAGFSTPALRKAIKRMRADQAVLAAEEEMIDLYVATIQGELFDNGE